MSRAGAPAGGEAPSAAAASGDVPEPPSRWRWTGGLPPLASSAIAIATMAMLGFGTWIGAIVTPAEGTESGEPTIIAVRPPSTSPTPPAQSAAPTSAASAPASEAASTPASQSAVPAATTTAPASTPSNATKPTSGGGAPPPATAALPPIKHVFLIVLADQGEGAAYSASSQAPYLSKTLAAQGELLRDYYAVSSGELANMIALVSGQGPTPQTAANCPLFSEVTPGTIGAEGQVLGTGCVYPQQTPTIASQLTSAGRTWRAYVGGLEDALPGQPTTCRHPALGGADANQLPTPGYPYVTWRNPFVYFDSVITNPFCSQDDVGVNALAGDLASASKTPSLAFIVPDSCHDGSPEPCAPGAQAGLADTRSFLEQIVPEIERSAAYREGGLIAITSDRAPQSGPEADSSGCCQNAPYPNLPAGATGATGASGATGATTTSSLAGSAGTSGGGKVGLLLISKYVKPGSVNALGQYNHFALLLSIEKLFELQPLGYAAAPGLLPFDTTVYNAFK